MTVEYICFIANRATGLPVEFFKCLHPKDAVKVKNKITSFFLRRGLKPDDGERIQEVCINLSLVMHSDYSHFMRLPIPQLMKTVKLFSKAVKNLGKQKHRISTRH